MNRLFSPQITVFANSLDPWIPEVWAQESLMVLFENLVAAQLVHTDFSDEVAQFGDVVNTRQPAKFTMSRKTDADDVTTSDATATNVAVRLDQHQHVSFVIKDGEESKGMQSLRETYLEPALETDAKGLDEMILGARYEFIKNTKGAGKLGVALDKSALIDVGVKLDELLCPDKNRRLIVSPESYGDLLNVSDFTSDYQIGEA